MRKSQKAIGWLAAAAVAGTLPLTMAAGSAGAAQRPAPAPHPVSVTLHDKAGQAVQVSSHGSVTVGRNAARFTEVPQRGGYELKAGSGRGAEFLNVGPSGASLSHRAGSVFSAGTAERSHGHLTGFSTIRVSRGLLTAQGSHLLAARQGHHGPSAQQEWAVR